MSEKTQTRECNKSTACPVISNESKQNKLLNKNRKSLKLHPPLIQAKIAISQPKNKVNQGKNASSIMHEMLYSPGKPLDLTTRAYMEPRLGYDFRRVRVHDDEFAHRVTNSLGLEAFAVENHVYFSRDNWQPGTTKSSTLLEHELGHVSRGESRYGTIQGWSSSGHRTITRRSLEGDTRYSPFAKNLLANTAPTMDYNRPQILQDMVSFWAGEELYRAPLGAIAGAVIGGITSPEQGTQVGSGMISGVLPQAVLGTGLISTVPVEERMRGPEGKEKEREELRHTRVTQELANHGEDLPERNESRMNEYTDKGIRLANCSDMEGGLVQLGYALHVAQDRGSHGDGYTAGYVQNKPHSDIDNMAKNTDGGAVAITHSREVLDRFFNGLTDINKRDLSSTLSLQLTRPPVAESLLAPPAAMPGPSFGGFGTDLQLNRGLNIFSIRF
jgi:hypothetical protein